MSILAVAEVAVHFEVFRNIDLFHQGLYHLKARVNRDVGNGPRASATPAGCLAFQPVQPDGSTKGKAPRPDHHNLIPAHTIEDQDSISTRSFLIRYCEEEVDLNDIGLFRFELDASEVELGAVLYLEVDLMFADLTHHGGADKFGEQPDVNSAEFKSVSSQLFRIRWSPTGIHEYFPIVFDEFHFCVANVVIHSALLDFRLRLQMNGCTALSLGEKLFGTCSSLPQERRAQLLQRGEAFYLRHVEALVASYLRLTEWVKQALGDCLVPGLANILRISQEGEVTELPLPTGFRYGLARAKSPSPSGDSSSTASTDTGSAHGRGRGSTMSVRQHLETVLGSDVSAHSVAALLAHDLSVASGVVAAAWHELLNLLPCVSGEVAARLREVWERQVAMLWNASLVKDPLRSDITIADGGEPGELRAHLAAGLRRAAGSQCLVDQPVVEDVSMIPKMDLRPFIFEQRYTAHPSSPPRTDQELDCHPPSAPKPYRGLHLFVLVHGFQGNSFDMRLMKNNLALLYPGAVFLASTCNEDNTDGDVNEMGVRLAQEVVNYISDWCPGSALGRLSFVAHSMGGLIARAALPRLHEYRSKMFTFLSLSCPHLGIFQDRLSLFNTGFWMLKQWRKSSFLQQISMADHHDLRESFLYKLSMARGFEYFQHVLLVACYEDQYGPFQSCRAEISRQWEGQSDKEVYNEMVQNIWRQVRPESVVRFDVNFVIPEKSLDTFIGRAAHIQFLECQPIMKMLVHNYSAFFR